MFCLSNDIENLQSLLFRLFIRQRFKGEDDHEEKSSQTFLGKKEVTLVRSVLRPKVFQTFFSFTLSLWKENECIKKYDLTVFQWFISQLSELILLQFGVIIFQTKTWKRRQPKPTCNIHRIWIVLLLFCSNINN